MLSATIKKAAIIFASAFLASSLYFAAIYIYLSEPINLLRRDIWIEYVIYTIVTFVPPAIIASFFLKKSRIASLLIFVLCITVMLLARNSLYIRSETGIKSQIEQTKRDVSSLSEKLKSKLPVETESGTIVDAFSDGMNAFIVISVSNNLIIKNKSIAQDAAKKSACGSEALKKAMLFGGKVNYIYNVGKMPAMSIEIDRC